MPDSRWPSNPTLEDDVEWYRRYENIVDLTDYLARNGWPADGVAYAVEKPWKYEDEFKMMKAERIVDQAQCQKPAIGGDGVCVRIAGHSGRCDGERLV